MKRFFISFRFLSRVENILVVTEPRQCFFYSLKLPQFAGVSLILIFANRYFGSEMFAEFGADKYLSLMRDRRWQMG